MAEESAQRHTGEFATPAAHHRASSQVLTIVRSVQTPLLPRTERDRKW